MPKTNKRKYRRRRTTRRRRNGTSTAYNNISGGFGQPKSQLVKLRYVDTRNVSSTGGLAGNWVLNAGSIFDPDVSGTGHQPMLHDQYATLYEKYTVVGAKLTIFLLNSQNGIPLLIAISKKNNSTTTLSIGEKLEQRSAGPWRLVGDRNGDGVHKMTAFYSARKEHGLDNAVDGDDISANFGFNPADSTYFHITTMPQDFSSTIAVDITCQVDYIVRLTEPKLVAQS